MKDVIASYETLINLFERTQYFLQRLSRYITASLTTEMTELFAKILAQVLSVIAFSTKEMKEKRISVLIFGYFFLADHSTEKFMKRLMGKAEAEDRLQQLDMLTKEENLMAAACTLKVAGVIRRDVDVIRDDAREIKEDTHDIEEDTRDIKNDTRDIKDDTRNINDNLEINKCGPPHPFNFFIFVLIFPYHMLIAIEELQTLLLLDTDRH